MARIRSIKPEFPLSETVGRLSRDARLLFVQLFTVVDDEGRSRAASRMLASLLYPYDDDARDLIDGWLSELEHQECIVRYEVDGAVYLEVCNWLKHQKIDHPSKSRLPDPREGSRILAPDLGPRIKDQDLGSKKDYPLCGEKLSDVPRETSKPRRKGTKLPLPDDWKPSPAHFAAASRLQLSTAVVEGKAEDMRIWAQSNDIRKANWDATFHGFLRNAVSKSGGQGGYGGSRPLQDDSRSISRAAGRLAEAAERGEFSFGPRPSLLPEPDATVVQLLPKGRGA
jgi:hypothetical protein